MGSWRCGRSGGCSWGAGASTRAKLKATRLRVLNEFMLRARAFWSDARRDVSGLADWNDSPLAEGKYVEHDDVEERNQHEQAEPGREAGFFEDEPVGNREKHDKDQEKDREYRHHGGEHVHGVWVHGSPRTMKKGVSRQINGERGWRQGKRRGRAKGKLNTSYKRASVELRASQKRARDELRARCLKLTGELLQRI